MHFSAIHLKLFHCCGISHDHKMVHGLCRAVKRLIESRIQVCVYTIYVCLLCIFILYLKTHKHPHTCIHI